MQRLRITVNGKAYEVEVEVLEEGGSKPSVKAETVPPTGNPTPAPATDKGGGDAVVSPLSASVISVNVDVGQQVKEGQNLMVLEAMKMNSHVAAHRAGTVERILVKAGQSVEEGQGLLILK